MKGFFYARVGGRDASRWYHTPVTVIVNELFLRWVIRIGKNRWVFPAPSGLTDKQGGRLQVQKPQSLQKTVRNGWILFSPLSEMMKETCSTLVEALSPAVVYRHHFFRQKFLKYFWLTAIWEPVHTGLNRYFRLSQKSCNIDENLSWS